MARIKTIPKLLQYHLSLCRCLLSFTFLLSVVVKSGCAKPPHHRLFSAFPDRLNFWVRHWWNWWKGHLQVWPTFYSSWSFLSSDKGSLTPAQHHRLRRAPWPYQLDLLAFQSAPSFSDICCLTWCLDFLFEKAEALHWRSVFYDLQN